MICHLYEAPKYLVFSPDVPALLYYAHIPTVIMSLIFGGFIFWQNKHSLLNKLLFAISILFLFWTTANLILWTNIHSDFMLFVWSLLGVVLGLIAIFCVYFVYVFLEKRDVPSKIKYIFLTLLIPVIILSSTNLNLSGFDLTFCDAFRFEWLPYKIYYSAFLGIFSALWIFVLLIRKYKKTVALDLKRQIILIGIGIELLLVLFFGMEFLGALIVKLGFTTDSSIEVYGMFGMVIFIVYLNILVVRYKAFNAKLLATQAFVFGLSALVGSQFFFIKEKTNFILNGITFFVSMVLSYFLIKAVKKEISQKDRLQQLAGELEKANLTLAESNEKLKGLDKLKTEFLSLASHQLRSPLTAIKGYASMLDEGAFGDLNKEQDNAVKRIYTSAQSLVNLVEDLLNVSKIEQGGMQYEFMPTDLSKMASELAGEVRIPVENKKLELKVSVPKNDRFMVSADPSKIRQVFLNLIDNSIKYTQSGSVTVGLKRDHENNVIFYVQDTGVGVTPETKQKLFEKFSRGEGGKLNTGGSGLGLYLAQEIAKAHKGFVDVQSEGVGKGSLFTVTLPAVASQKDGSYITT